MNKIDYDSENQQKCDRCKRVVGVNVMGEKIECDCGPGAPATMTTMEIYYNDLSETAKFEFDALFGPPEEHNHAISPLFIYEVEEEADGQTEVQRT